VLKGEVTKGIQKTYNQALRNAFRSFDLGGAKDIVVI
jgi:hypothetical protein